MLYISYFAFRTFLPTRPLPLSFFPTLYFYIRVYSFPHFLSPLARFEFICPGCYVQFPVLLCTPCLDLRAPGSQELCGPSSWRLCARASSKKPSPSSIYPPLAGRYETTLRLGVIQKKHCTSQMSARSRLRLRDKRCDLAAGRLFL